MRSNELPKIFIEDLFKEVSQPAYSSDQLRKRGLNDAEIAAYQSIRDVLNTFLKEVVDRWKVLDKNYVEVDEIVDKFIKTKIGELKDFPYELYETIQHILYEYFGLLKEAIRPGWLPHQINNPNDIKAGLDLFIEERAKLQGTVDGLPEIIKELRNIPVPKRQYAVKLILDQIKYDIKNVGYKPEFLRIIERKWKNFKQKLSGE